MSLLWHISVFVFAFQYFTQPFPKDVARSFTTFAHFQKKISLTNRSTRQLDGCKAKHYSPSAFPIITRSYLSQGLGQHWLFWEAERGIVDDGNLSCFSELNKNIQLRFTSLLSAEVRRGVPSIPVNAAALRWNRNDCMEARARGQVLASSFSYGLNPHTDNIPSATRRSEVFTSQADSPPSYQDVTYRVGLRFFHS